MARNRRPLRRSYRFALALFVIGILVAPVAVAFAQAPLDPPSTLTVDEARVFGGVFEAGDMLFVARYQVTYPAGQQPAVTITTAYVTTVYDATSTPVSTGAPVSFVNDGYGYGAFALYLDAADVAALSLSWNTGMGVAIAGNPTQFVTVPTSGVFGALNWVDETVSSRDLSTGILQILTALQQTATWTTSGTRLVEASSGAARLSEDGELYIDLVIPGIRAAAPDMYAARQRDLLIDRRTMATSTGAGIEQQLDGSVIGNAITSLANGWNLDTGTLKVALALVLAASLAAITAMGTGLAPEWTFMAFMFGLVASGIIGLLSMAVLFMAIFLIVITAGWLIWKPG